MHVLTLAVEFDSSITRCDLLCLCIQTSQFYYEEEEASKRDPAKDLELHRNVCVELCRMMDRLKELKADPLVRLSVELVMTKTMITRIRTIWYWGICQHCITLSTEQYFHWLAVIRAAPNISGFYSFVV